MNKLLIIPVLLMFINSNAQSFNEALDISGGNRPFDNINGTTAEEFASLTGNPESGLK